MSSNSATVRRRIRTIEQAPQEEQDTGEELNALVQRNGTEEGQSDFTPEARMQEVAAVDKQYAKEYRLRLLHRMLMRNVPLDQIARELGVAVRTVIRDREELRDRLRQEAKGLDINHILADTIAFYNEIQGMSMRIASKADSPAVIRLSALRTASTAKLDLHKFLHASGVFDVLRYRASDDKNDNDIKKLMDITKSILGDETGDDVKQIIEDDSNIRLL